MQFNLFSVPIIFGIGFLSFLMYLVTQRNRGHVVKVFILFSGLVILYSSLFCAYLLVSDATLQIFFFYLMVFFSVFIPLVTLFFILEYLGYDSWINWKSISIFLFIPVVTGFLELTDPLHGLFWEDIEIITYAGFTYVQESPGFIPIILSTYLYFILGISMALLFWGIFHIPKQHRPELNILIVALAMPLLFDLIRSSQLNPWPHLYITPYGVMISVILLGVSIIKYDFLNAIPAAYSRLFSEVTDAILVFDHKYTLLDLNNAARKLFYQQPEQPYTSIKDFPEALQEAVTANDIEVALSVEGELSYFDLKRSEIKGKDDLLRSVILTLRDVSWRKQLEMWHQDLIKDKESLLAEKEVLLKEINHRVKNNFTLAGSLLFLEAQKFQDKNVREAFEVSRDRLRTMSLLNERLYHTEQYNNLDLGSYLCSLAEDLISMQSSPDASIDFRSDVVTVLVDPREAIPCGLIVNELVTNSLKYAFQKECERKPTILLKLSQGTGGMIKLQVNDNGCGYPETMDFQQRDTLGMRLVHMLGQDQLNGTVQIGSQEGAKFSLSFFKEEKED